MCPVIDMSRGKKEVFLVFLKSVSPEAWTEILDMYCQFQHGRLFMIRIQEIAEQVVRYPEMVFTTLWHKGDVNVLREAYHRTCKSDA
jgi:hypothetical protein